MLEPLPDTTGIVSGEEANDWYQVYFSDPNSPTASSYRGGPDEALAEAIDQARFQIDVAVYDLDLWSIRDALIAARRREVAVRVVVESSHLDEDAVQSLVEVGIPVVDDQNDGLMHNKFVVIDGTHVWLGSMNLTVNGVYKNNNNLIYLRSSRLAENYTHEFEEMFTKHFFGSQTVEDTPHPLIDLNGSHIETYFSPDDGTAQRIVELIQNAEESIYFLAFSFTSDPIAEAMLEQSYNGVTVIGVFDEGQYYSNIGTEFDHFHEAGLDVRLDGNSARMHHKLIIIDGSIVVTGSYNFSASAEKRNDENTLVIHNSDIALKYIAEFERVYAEAPQE
ncbi:MAG: phospholipase D-like domain-containing protein [Chloroflexota bacterium]|nr:phospholipase D-like domain-containing protein [Chloroflexota bacterium]